MNPLKWFRWIQIVLLSCVVLVLVSLFFTKREIIIRGNEYLDPSFISSFLPKKTVSLWEFDQHHVVQALQMNPFIQSVSIHIKYFDTLMIQLELVPLVGRMNIQNQEQFLSEIGQIISGNFVKSDFFLPNIISHTDIKELSMKYFAQQLAIFKNSYQDFFLKIKKIELSNPENVSIFILRHDLGGLKEYRLHHLPSTQDWIKIQILDGKYKQGSVVVLDGDSVVVQG